MFVLQYAPAAAVLTTALLAELDMALADLFVLALASVPRSLLNDLVNANSIRLLKLLMDCDIKLLIQADVAEVSVVVVVKQMDILREHACTRSATAVVVVTFVGQAALAS